MKNILIIQLRQLGDILLTTPCIKAIRSQFPDANIDFLTHEMGKDILSGNPFLTNHLVYNEKNGVLSGMKLLKTLRSKSYDVVLDYMNNPRSALMSLAAGKRNSISFESKRRMFYSKTVPKSHEKTYIVDQKFELLKAAGIQGNDRTLIFPWDQLDLKPFKAMVAGQESFAVAKLRVLLSPTHRRTHRRWPQQHYAVLADFLTRKWNASVTWLWGPGEEEYVRGIQERCEEKTILAPSTSIKEMAGLIANHDLFIGNSNGPSHIAVATNICSLQLHGHTSATSWCPNNLRHRSIQSPINDKHPDRCMPLITVPVVIEKLASMKEEIEKVAEFRWNEGVITDWQRQNNLP